MIWELWSIPMQHNQLYTGSKTQLYICKIYG